MYFTPYISVFSPNSGKYRPEITSYGHFSLSDTTTPTPSFMLYLRKTTLGTSAFLYFRICTYVSTIFNSNFHDVCARFISWLYVKEDY